MTITRGAPKAMPETYPPDKEKIQYKERPLTAFDMVGRLVGFVSLVVVIIYVFLAVIVSLVILLHPDLSVCYSSVVPDPIFNIRCGEKFDGK